MTTFPAPPPGRLPRVPAVPVASPIPYPRNAPEPDPCAFASLS